VISYPTWTSQLQLSDHPLDHPTVLMVIGAVGAWRQMAAKASGRSGGASGIGYAAGVANGKAQKVIFAGSRQLFVTHL